MLKYVFSCFETVDYRLVLVSKGSYFCNLMKSYVINIWKYIIFL